MKLENTFEVPLPPDQAWALLRDIERIAPCLPGAQLTEIVDENTYKGTVALRLGPVGLSFAGTARFVEIDDAGLSARVKAQGMDSKGRGGAVADVGFRVVGADGGSEVRIETDLTLSGSIAQYGRGVGIIQATSEQLIGEFADNLKHQLADTAEPSRPAGTGDGTAEGQAPPPAATPIAGFRLMFRAVWVAIKRLFGAGGKA
ncbi:MAG: SRPBCC family protein [Alphaproteobacteria bacterium]|nr:SRPBCC family protein [Alphaproteobacteria bacterium]